ncbi:transcription factor SRM1-like [Phaseolus vulgaris]
MSRVEGNEWESALNDELFNINFEDIFGVSIDQMLGDVNYPEETSNLQGQPLSQQSFSDHPLTQLNESVTHVESGPTQLPDNPPNSEHQNGGCGPSRQRQPRKTWSIEEHKLFLLGLRMYGGSWKKISENVVRTKTPSQLASHAQKYFIRQKMEPSQRKRKSIHDITLELE